MQEFDKATKGRGKGPRSSSETGESVDQDDSDADVPARTKVSGRHHVWLKDAPTPTFLSETLGRASWPSWRIKASDVWMGSDIWYARRHIFRVLNF